MLPARPDQTRLPKPVNSLEQIPNRARAPADLRLLGELLSAPAAPMSDGLGRSRLRIDDDDGRGESAEPAERTADAGSVADSAARGLDQPSAEAVPGPDRISSPAGNDPTAPSELVSARAVPKTGPLPDVRHLDSFWDPMSAGSESWLAAADSDASSIPSSVPADASERYSELMEQLQYVTDLRKRQKILMADLAVDGVHRQIENMNVSRLPDDVQVAIGQFREMANGIRKDAQDVRRMIREAQTRDRNWILSNEDESSRTRSFHRLNSDRSVISFKVEARAIRCNVFNLLALFNEFDLLPEIVSNPLASIDIEPLLTLKFRKLMLITVSPIWPFAARDIALDISGFDVLDQKCVVICGQSFETAEEVGVCAFEGTKAKRISSDLSGVVLRPIDENLTSMVVIANLDLKLGVIPPALVHFITKKLTLPVFQMVIRQAERLPESERHRERLAADRFGIYETIREGLRGFDYEESQLAENEAHSQTEELQRSSASLAIQPNHLHSV